MLLASLPASSSRSGYVSPLREPDTTRQPSQAAPEKPSESDASPGSPETLRRLAEIGQLKTRDREVRAHEQAHASVGGQYAGAPSYDFQRGPDGVLYAVGGEVPIDISPVPGDPSATLAKAEQVQRAALAPKDPSGADRRIAARAAGLAAQARQELARLRQQADAPDGSKAPGERAPAAAFDTRSRVGQLLDLSA